MDILNLLEENTSTIVVTSYSNKLNILKKLNNIDKLFDVNFITLDELTKRYYFSYDENAIYYLMDKYGFNRDIAGIYLSNMYYVLDKDYNNDKLNTLVKLKKELDGNGLLIKDNLFKAYIKDKKIIFHDYRSFSHLERTMISHLEKTNKCIITSSSLKNYQHVVYEFDTIFEEVEYVAKEISRLVSSSVSLSNIKLTNVNSDYYDIITRVFSMYNLRVNFDNNKLISTKVAKDFLLMEGPVRKRITALSEKYKNSKVLDKIISICNKYISFSDISIVNEMISYDFKNTYLEEDIYKNTIEVIDYLNDYISDEMHVFMLSFQNDVPVIYKDEDFITDNIKNDVLLDSTFKRNKISKKVCKEAISSIRNLTITYKNSSPSGVFYPSNLIGDMDMSVIKPDNLYNESYSKISDMVNLSKGLDSYLKTGEVTSSLKLLYNSYDDISYNSYDNSFTGVKKNLLMDYFSKGYNLSYSSMDSFYKCPFRYYLSHVLKLDIYEERFEAYVGSLFHYVLEKALKCGGEVSSYIDEFISNSDKSLTKKEEFFIKKLSKSLEFIHKTILDHLDNSNLKNMLFEERVVVTKDKDVSVTFKGFIDKIMYEEKEGSTIVAIIDYKTGSADINLGYVPYGLSMQLPVYLYLAKNSNKLKNIKFAGFYLQRILSGPYNISSKMSLEDQKRDSLLLNGYSNIDQDTLYEFDKTYKMSKYIKSMKVLNNGNFFKYSKVLTDEEIEVLINIVDDKIDNAITLINNGSFSISPKRTEKEMLGCKFCKYNDICFKESKDDVYITIDKDLSYLGGDDNA